MQNRRLLILLALVLCFCSVSILGQNSISIGIDYAKVYKLNKDVYGCNNWISTRPYYLSDNSFIKKYADLEKPTMRYPGGTASNYLNLASGFHELWPGSTDNDRNRVNAFNSGMNIVGKDVKGEEIGRFIKFLKATDARSTFVLNLTVMTLSEIESVLDSLVQNHVDLEYVEMGNELYYGQYSAVVPDVTSYVALAKQRAVLVKKRFPNAKIGVLIPSQIYTSESFLPGEGASQDRQEKWYDEIKKENFYDGIVIHLYSTVGMDSKVSEENFLPYQTAYRHAISHADQKMDELIPRLEEDFLDKEIWVTEYHVGGFGGDVRSYRLRHSYLGAMYASNFMLKLFTHKSITLGSWHSMVQWLDYNATGNLLDDNYDFNTKINYHFFKLFGKPIKDCSHFAKLNVTGNIEYSGIGKYDGKYDDVEGGTFVNIQTGKAYLILFNKWRNSYSINKSVLEEGISGTISKCMEISPEKSLYLDEALKSEQNFSRTEIEPTNGNYMLLPFSAYVIEYDLKATAIPTSTKYKKDLESIIKVYPNPTSGKIDVESKVIGDKDWRVYNNLGQLIDCGSFVGSNTKIELKEKGIQILQIIGNEFSHSQKVLNK